MTDRPGADPQVVDRVRRLFLYLRELADLRTKSVRDHAAHERVIWFNDLPSDAGVSLFDGALLEATADERESWLEIDRVALPRLPEPPEPLGDWFRRSDLFNADLDRPPLLDREDDEVERPLDLDDVYQRYVDDQWRPWAEENRRLEPAHDFYADLFATAERQQALGEVYELVVGIGLLAWRTGDDVVRRHLITTPVEASIDRDSGRITVRPSDSPDARNRLELEMLDAGSRGDSQANRELGDEIDHMVALDLAGEGERLLRQWLDQAHPSGSVATGLAPIASAQQTPQISLAPALILRRRGQRNLGALLEAIAHQVAETGDIPHGVVSLAVTGDLGPFQGGESDPALDDPEVYFPLPWNDEQRQIVERLRYQHGIVVQGPPGTGKSHTIANLISHLLAQGKRVLVTSHTERALRVLHDKLPDEIKPLCISLLGQDRESLRALEASVEEISARQADWSDLEKNRDIAGLRRSLRAVRHARTQVEEELRRAREAETGEISVGTYRGTAHRIAQRLNAERDGLGWIEDVPVSAEPPLTEDELTRLVELTWTLPEMADDLAAADLPAPGDLVGAAELERLKDAEERIVREYGAAKDRFGVDLDRWGEASLERFEQAETCLRNLVRHVEDVVRLAPWAETAVRDVLSGRAAVWEALYDEANDLQIRAAALAEAVGDAQVDLVEGHGRDATVAAAEELLEHVRSGGRLRTGILSPAPVRRHRWLLEGVRVAGRPVDSKRQLTTLLDCLRLDAILDRVAEVWRPWMDESPVPSVRQRVAFHASQLVVLGTVLDTMGIRRDCNAALQALGDGPSIPNWADVADIRLGADALRAVREFRNVEAVRGEIASAKRRLGNDPHPIVAALRNAIDAGDIEAYRRHLGDLRQAAALARDARDRASLAERLRAGAPRLAARLPEEGSDVWLERAAVFEDAWRWKFAHDELARTGDPELLQRLNRAVDEYNAEEREILAGLSAKLAWRRMFDALGNEQSQALRAWADAVRRFGRGTGRRAPQLLRMAREYMDQARSSIPAWIMPMYRVAESLAAQPNAFDVVIVDEASQSGVESLFLLYLGKQVVVVGDEQQIAPDAVGVSLEQVQRLQREYLADIPFADLYALDSSLFAQAAIRFPKQVVLREHFRCMPEIIEFSNRIAYQQQTLLPLRQFGADRLDPIKTVYLPHGHREGSGGPAINEPEADEIVTRIEKLLSDPRYDGASIGVISLQGDKQARRIERMLLERIGPQAFVERNITCGDAYAFQGDERRVVFLSMVAAPNAHIGPLANEQARHRFNVAASRAQDQVWLVHSVRPEDLGPTDMRRTMLEYYLSPQIEHLEELDEFDTSEMNPVFDSMFEQDVYLEIRRRGYRVAPQVPVARHRIDLVVEGAGGRLAVQCDGDEWHGADEWERDMARQRWLERCGWSFVRIRGSDFYRDPASALEPLWRELDRRGIQPHPVLDVPVVTAVEPMTGPSEEKQERFGEPDHVWTADTGEHVGGEREGDGSDERRAPVTEPASDGPGEEWRWPPEWGEQPRLGAGVRHPSKGPGRVRMAARVVQPGQPFVRIRFESGEQDDYTPEEYHEAGFTIVHRGPHQRLDAGP